MSRAKSIHHGVVDVFFLLLLKERLFGLLEGVAGGVVERLVVFHLALQGVAGAGDVDNAALVRGLDVRPVVAPAVSRSLGQFKKAVHGYRKVHPALRDRLRLYQPQLRRDRVALR